MNALNHEVARLKQLLIERDGELEDCRSQVRQHQVVDFSKQAG